MTKLLLDETYERAGWAVMVAGILIALAGSAAVLIATAAAAWYRVEGPPLGPAATVACLGGALAVGGLLALVGVKRFAGTRVEGPGGTSFEVAAKATVEMEGADG